MAARFFLSYLCAVSLISCKDLTNPPGADTPSLYSPPDTIPLDLEQGYKINLLSGDSIKHIYNYFTDTIKSGVPIPLKGKIISTDTITPSRTFYLDVERKFTLPSNVSLIPPDVKTVRVNEKSLARYVPGLDTCACLLIGTYGDTIPYLTPTVISGIKSTWMPPAPVKASKPKMRENTRYNIQFLDQDQGLTTPEVLCMTEDHRGNIWIGTVNEFTQYDGTFFRHYNNDDLTILRYGFSVFSDSRQHMWFSTAAGIIRTDGQNVTTYRSEDRYMYRNEVRCGLEDHAGQIWFGSRDGVIMKFNPGNEGKPDTITHLKLKANAKEWKVIAMHEDSKNNIWFGTNGDGLFRYDQKAFTQYTVVNGLLHNNITAILEDKTGNLWLGTSEGLCRYRQDRDQSEFTYYTTAHGLSNNRITSIAIDDDGNLWIGTWGGGVNKLSFDEQNRAKPFSFTHFKEADGLSDELVKQVLIDHAGSVWIATADGGVNVLKPKSFTHLNDIEGFTDLRTRTIYEDHKGHLWFGSENEGLSVVRLPQAKGQPLEVRQYGVTPDMKFQNNSAMLEDKEKNLWFGATHGVWRMRNADDADRKEFTYFTWWHQYNEGWVSCIQEDEKGNLWIGTYGSGLIHFKPRENQMIHYSEYFGFTCDYIYDLVIDPKGILWIATDQNGLCRFEPSADGTEATMTNYTEREGLPSNYLQDIAIDPSSALWLGTIWSGVVQFVPPQKEQSGKFISYTTKQGLSHNRTTSVLVVQDSILGQHVWTGTDNGLNIIRSENEKVFNKVISFGKTEGLKSQSFNVKCVAKDRENKMWWGIGKDLEQLPLQSLTFSGQTPQPFLRQIVINEQSFNFRQLPDSLSELVTYNEVASFENYPMTPEISYKLNHLTFHYSATDWHAPSKIKYSFKMDGLKADWSHPSSETHAEYRNLSAGTYTFILRAIGESQTWSEPFTYTFTIRPPWWYSWWAFSMYAILGGFVLYRTHRYQLHRKLEMEEKKRLVELDRVKNRLYTNITHEFRTPLTLIHGPVAQALSKKAALELKDIESIYRQSERLQELINQMLELQKLESGMLKPNFAYGEIVQTLRYLFGSFETWAKEKNISLIFSSSLQEVYMDYDKEKLTQIMTNLISNAIRHTNRGGKVAMTINASSFGDHLLIQVADTGVGIDEPDLQHVFDRFYQSKRASVGGTGIGLAIVKNLVELLGGTVSVESKIDMGTTFKVSFPITRQAPKVIADVDKPPTHETEQLEVEPKFPNTENPSTGKPIIMVVEDNHDVAQYLISCLQDQYATILATNGKEGVAMAYEHIPDLIISDVMMPGKDGFELCHELKNDIQTSHIPIILLTGRGDHEAKMTGIGEGADAYVVKPFDPAELELRVKKLLELRANLSLHYRKLANTQEPETVVQASAKENEFLKKIREFVMDHMTDAQFNMDMLCHYMAMSHPQMHRKITALTGESVGKFVRSIRLARAKDLLLQSDMTISEIAYETGFSEPGYFAKVFAKEFNQTPSEYRAHPSS